MGRLDYTFHCYGRTEGIAGVIISKGKYPSLAAHQILSKVVDEFLSQNPVSSINAANTDNSVNFPALKKYLQEYQDPNQVGSITRIQQELDETKIVLHKTIESGMLSADTILPADMGADTLQCFNVARNSTRLWRRVTILVRSPRCSTSLPRSRTPAVS